MSNYTKATNFTAKDSLPSGNSGKIVKGTELDVEFTAIASAIASKSDSNSPTFTGTVTVPSPTDSNSTQAATTAFVTSALAGAFTTGMIMLWSGSIASIPSGWYLCNGSNGTPDLRDRFVVGAGSSYAVGTTGGSKDAIVVSHTHTATSTSTVSDPGHSHSITSYSAQGANSVNSAGNSGFSSVSGVNTNSASTGISVGTTTTVSSTGSSGTNANLPPYYALAYIMKA